MLDFIKLDSADIKEEPSNADTTKINVNPRDSFPSAPYRRINHPAEKSLLFFFFTSVLYSFVTILVCVPSWALILLFVPVGFLVDLILGCYGRCVSPDDAQRVDKRDLMWLTDCCSNKRVVQAVIVLERGLCINRIRELINTCLVCAVDVRGQRLYSRFEQRIIHKYHSYWWVQHADFNIADHVFSVSDGIDNSNDLKQYITKMANCELSFDKPLWEVQVLSDYGPDKDTVLLWRAHAVITDGTSIASIFAQALCDTQLIDNQPRHAYKANFLFSIVWAICIAPVVLLSQFLCYRKYRSPLNGQMLHGNKDIAWSEPIDLSVLKRMKAISHSSLNDIIMGVSAGTIRTYIQALGVQNPYNVNATIPVNLRSGPVDSTMGTESSLNNVCLPTNTEGNIPRQWEVKMWMDEFKSSIDPLVMYGAWQVAFTVLPMCVCKKLWNYLYDQSVCTISNLAGPANTVTLGSKRVKSVMYWMPPQAQQSLSLSFLTFGNLLQMTVTTNTDVIQDSSVIVKIFNEKMSEIQSLLAFRRVPGEILEPAPSMDPTDKDYLTTEQLHNNLLSVQKDLATMKNRLSSTSMSSNDERLSVAQTIMDLRRQFRHLLYEIQRRKGTSVNSDETTPFMEFVST